MPWWIVLIALCFLCYGLFKFVILHLHNRELYLTDFKRYLLGLGIVILVFIPYFAYENSISVKDGEKYYVNLFTEKDFTKNYRVPGMIIVNEYGYHLIEVYWPNGGKLSFEYNSQYTDLVIGEKILAEDDEGEDWYVELTREKVNP